MSTSSETTAPVTTSVTTASSTTNIPTSTQTTPITSTKLPTTSESTTAESTTTTSSTTSTTTNNPTTSAAVTSESTTLSSTTMATSSEKTAPVTTSVTTASSTTNIPTSTQTTPITSTTLPTTSEGTTAGSATTASSTTSTTTNNPTTSAAVTSESTTLSSTTMSTSSETTAPVKTSITTASSTTDIPTTTVVSTQTTPITSTTLPTTSESTTAASTTTASSTTSTTTNNPTTSAAVTSESTTLTSTTLSTSSETTAPVKTSITTASSTTNIPTGTQTTPITSTTLPTTLESTTAGSTTTASSTTSTTTNNPTTSAAVTSESTTLSSTTMSTSSESIAPVTTSVTTASSTTNIPTSTQTTPITSTTLPTTSESTTAGSTTTASSSTSTTTNNPTSSAALTSESTTLSSTTMSTSSETTAPVKTSITTASSTTSIPTSTQTTPITSTTLPTTSESTTLSSTTTASSTTSTTTNNPTTSAAVTSESTTLSSTTMSTSSDTTAPVKTSITTASSTTNIPTSTQTTPITSTTLPTTSESTTAGSTTTASSSTSTTTNNPTISAAVTSESKTLTSTTMLTSSETTAPVTTLVTTASSTTEIPTTKTVSTQTTPITSTTLPTTSESTTVGSTTTASSSTSTTTNNPTTSAAVTSESTTLSSTTMSTSSETTAPVTRSVTTASSTTNIPTGTQTTPITSTTLPTTSESTTAGSTTTASSTTSTTTNNPTTSGAVTSESTTLSSTTMSTSSETTAPVKTSITTASSTTDFPITKVVSTETTTVTSTKLPLTSESTTAETTSKTTVNPSSTAVTSESTTLTSTTMPTSSSLTPSEIKTMPTASTTAASTTTVGPSTTVASTSKTTTASSTSMASSAVIVPSSTSSSPTSSESPLQSSSTVFNPVPIRSTTSESTTAHTTSASATTLVPSTIKSAATSSEAPSTQTGETTMTFAATTSKTTTPPTISTTSESTPALVTTMPVSSSHVTILPTLTPTKTTESPRTPTVPITTTITTTATPPSSTAAQTTTQFQETSGDLLKTTVAFTSTSSAPATLALSTKTTSSPNMDSETTTALTTTTGIITGFTNTPEFPLVKPITSSPNTNTSTSPASTIPGHTSIKTIPAETLTSNTTPLNNTTKADATLQSTSSLQPETSNILKTFPTNVSGAATVTTRFTFSSLSSLPTETLVLGAVSNLLKSRESQLNESLKISNFTYQKISETSYAVILNIMLNNISMPEDPQLRNSSYVQVQYVVNNALNTLLNEPGKQVFEPKSSNFTSTPNQIDGMMDYSFQDGDTIQPVSFLKELLLTTTTVLPQTTISFSMTPSNSISGSAVVTSKLVFNSSSPVPSEALVLSAINTLRNSRESQLNESVKVVNASYEKISETSYAVVFTFKLVNISITEDPVLTNNTYPQVQDVVNKALNTLLNEPGQQVFKPNSFNFTSTPNQIEGMMDYSFQDGDTIQPVSFLKELLLTTTTVLPQTTTGFSVTPPNLVSGSAVVTSKLVFNSSSPVPSEALVLSAINTLRNSRESQLNESVKVVNASYEKISETSYAVVFTFKLVNISMPEDPALRNNTYPQVQDVINKALNTLLNEPGQQVFKPNSFNFTSTPNQIDGRMDYSFQDGDTIQPVSFLKELLLTTTTTVLPQTTISFSMTPSNSISGSAVVTSKLVFNSSSPVPSEALVLSAINTLRNSRESQLYESVKVVNASYEKISETSYAVVFTFKLVNISITEDPVLTNNTYPQVQDVVNKALNTLLNEPGQQVFKPNSFNFTSTPNQIEGRMDYSFQDGDTIQPVSFLKELLLTTTTVLPQTTTGFSVTPPNLVSGSAVVTSKLVFNSSSPVPSEALVLSAINTLRNSRESQLNESVKVVNASYEKISETSYAVVFTFKLVNISMPEDPALRNNTYPQVQDVINKALNTLLNEPGQQVFKPNSFNFTSTPNQIDGRMDYSFQDGDTIQPVSFLKELLLTTTTTVLPQTTISFSMTPSNSISGSAVVTSKLVFNSSSPVPSEALVLNAINTLRNSRESQLNESVKVVNASYEKISETSYAVVFTFKLVNISMPEDPALRNNTYPQVQDVINKALNTLLNEPGQQVFKPNSFNFTSTPNQIDGRMDYSFQDGDTIQPVSFLKELLLTTTTTVLPQTTTGFSVTPPNLVSGSAVVTSKLVFNSSSPVPSEALVLSAINTLRNSRESQLNESVKVVNVSYEKITATSYAVIFKLNLSNISMSKDPELRNGTYLHAQGVANNALNSLLNEPGRTTLNPKSANFISTSNQIEGSIVYSFQDGDAIQPVSFLNELRSLTVSTTTSTLTTTPQIVLGRALIFIRLVFVTLGPLPNPDKVLEVANTLLKTRITTKQDPTTQDLSDPVSFVNVTYTKINETAYALNFGFEISNITMNEKLELRNGTHLLIQDSVNTLLSKILLSNSSAPVIKFNAADFTGNSTVIQAKVEYVFSPSDITQPSVFVQELLQLNEATTQTTTSPPILSRRAIIRIRLEFITLGPRPSENSVLDVVKSVVATNLTSTLSAKTVSVSEPVTLANVNYLGINDTAYALIFAFEISKVSLTESKRNETYQEIQKKINNLVIQILKDPSINLLIPANFKDDSTMIEANVTYVFSQRESNTAAGFLVGTLFTVFYHTSSNHHKHYNLKQRYKRSMDCGYHCPLRYYHRPRTLLDSSLLFAVWLLCSNQETLAQKKVVQCTVHNPKQPLLESSEIFDKTGLNTNENIKIMDFGYSVCNSMLPN
ncbi:mucin-5AC [Carassius auratus]|uniref:Mucin-5AC n=1 Tax=Carassius auratus TaxID=7957 RepID=A0A6P6PKF2_CARAU|nr:mucin-5AC-like [Carassius auratus]